MPDLREDDPITVANTAIRDYIRACGGRISAEARPGYAQLVEYYFQAVRERDMERQADPAALAA